jgi:hypothetical protein
MATHFLNRKRGAPGAGQKKRGSGLH